MSSLWQAITLKHLGVPALTKEMFFEIKPKAKIITWIKHLKPDPKADYFLIIRNQSCVENYLKLGGDPAKVIIHHLSYDTGIIDPLWGTGFFETWCNQLKGWGVNKIVPPDFSAWADFPYVVQLHNIYKSVVVARDFADQGFKLLPLLYWSAPPLFHISTGMWPEECKCGIIDGGHIYGNVFNEKIFWDGATWFTQNFPQMRNLLMYSRSPRAVQDWNTKFPVRPVQWQPSVMYARDKLISGIRKRVVKAK